MEDLLNKYAGGRIPPLVPPASQPSEKGLLNGDLVAIYQRGFSGTYSIPLGILAATSIWEPSERKWETADYRLNEYAERNWISLCKHLRAIPAEDKACEACDRLRAKNAEEERKVIAYICHNGMIDFAIPVFLDGIVVAVLFAGQRKPKSGESWSERIVTREGLYRPLRGGESGSDIWPHCANLIGQAEKRGGFKQGELFSLLEDDIRKDSNIEVTPCAVEQIMVHLTKASEHLSQLAATTFHLEKARVVAWIRSEVAECLRHLTLDASDLEGFWDSVSQALALTTRYFGCDYAAVISCQADPKPTLRILAQSPKHTPSRRPGIQEIPVSGEAVRRLVRACAESDDVQEVDPTLYIRALQGLSPKASPSRGIARAASIPGAAPNDEATLIVMGHTDKEFSLDRLPDVDQQALRDVLGAASTVVKVALLIDQLKFAAQRQATFVLDVAHDIRNPIQAIVTKAERLRYGMPSAREIAYQSKRLAAQVKRLHLLSERVWTLEALERGTFKLEENVRVNVYEVFRECRDSLLDLASGHHVKITVQEVLQDWPAMYVDRRFFTQAVLNLLDNAIKYSHPDTEVRVDGKEDVHDWCISVVNRGIPIHPEESEKIFDRFYRTLSAQQHVREGTGIGLFLVKKFADKYGMVSVRSQPVPRTSDFVTEFILSINKREIHRYV